MKKTMWKVIGKGQLLDHLIKKAAQYSINAQRTPRRLCKNEKITFLAS